MYNLVFVGNTRGTLFNSALSTEFLDAYSKFPKTVQKGFFADCFEAYFSKISVKEGFYFTFPILPLWMEEFVDELNKFFKDNITVKFIMQKPVYVKSEESPLSSTGFITTISEIPTETKFLTGIFHISFNEKYSADAQYLMQYIIHHILRQFSLCEHVLFNYYKRKKPAQYKGSYLDLLIDAVNLYNSVSNYRTLYGEEFSLVILNSLNNIDAMNLSAKIFSSLGVPRQTDILKLPYTIIKHRILYMTGDTVEDGKKEIINFETFKPGDIITGNKINKTSYHLTKRNCVCIVTKNLRKEPKTIASIEMLDSKNIYGLNSNQFNKLCEVYVPFGNISLKSGEKDPGIFTEDIEVMFIYPHTPPLDGHINFKIDLFECIRDFPVSSERFTLLNKIDGDNLKEKLPPKILYYIRKYLEVNQLNYVDGYINLE